MDMGYSLATLSAMGQTILVKSGDIIEHCDNALKSCDNPDEEAVLRNTRAYWQAAADETRSVSAWLARLISRTTAANAHRIIKEFVVVDRGALEPVIVCKIAVVDKTAHITADTRATTADVLALMERAFGSQIPVRRADSWRDYLNEVD